MKFFLFKSDFSQIFEELHSVYNLSDIRLAMRKLEIHLGAVNTTRINSFFCISRSPSLPTMFCWVNSENKAPYTDAY